MPLMVEHTGTGGTESSGMTRPALRCSAALPACAASFSCWPAVGPADAADCVLRAAGRRPRRRRGRCAQPSPRRRPRNPPRRHRARWNRQGAATGPHLSAIAAGREVTLHGDDDTPDRYGRQAAFVFVAGSEHSVQSELLRRGEALVSADIADKNCAAALAAAEGAARDAKLGIWADPSAIKNAESPGDILSAIGQFTVVEGRVLSVRQAGAITYLNFGRNWTRDFAATISRRMIPAFESCQPWA